MPFQSEVREVRMPATRSKGVTNRRFMVGAGSWLVAARGVSRALRGCVSEVETIERSIRLLEELSAHGDGLGVLSLSKQTGVPPATAHRILNALLKHNLVVQENSSGHYRLGPRILGWTQSYLDRNDLVTAARPYLAQLSSHTKETAFLTTLLSDYPVCVAIAESSRPLRFFIRIGQRMPYHAAASARSILAFRPLREAERLLIGDSLTGFTRSTATTIESAMEGLSEIREQGYAVCDQELEVGVTAIAAPIRDITGEVVASITVVAPSDRLLSVQRTACAARVIEAASGISGALGYPVSSAAGSARHTVGTATARSSDDRLGES